MSTSAPDGQQAEVEPRPETTEPSSGPEDRSDHTYHHRYVSELRSEAAAHRRRAKEAETERDQLRERVERRTVRRSSGWLVSGRRAPATSG